MIMKGQLTFQIKSLLEDYQGEIELVRENVINVLRDWEYEIVEVRKDEYVFNSINRYMPRQEAYLITHSGIIKLQNGKDFCLVKMLYTIDYWQDILLLLCVIIIAETTDMRAYYCSLLVVIQFIYKIYRIRKKCKAMMLEFLSF